MKNLLMWLAAIAAFVLYLGWVIEDPVSLLLLGLAVGALLIRALVVVAVVGGAALVAWRFLRPAQREFYSRHRIRLFAGVTAGLVFFVVAGFWLNRHALPSRYHPMSIAVDIAVALFAVLLTWALLSPTRRKAVLALPVTGAFAVAIFALVALAPSAGGGGAGGDTDALATLGYLTWVPVDEDADSAGVVYHDSLRAFPGYNFWGPRSEARAHLMDMDGNILHTWERRIEPEDNWSHIELLPDGGIIALVRQKYVLCLDWDSNIRWMRELRAHHDVAVSDTGDVYVLTRAERMVRSHGWPLPVLDDLVTILDRDGHTLRQFSLYDIIGEIVPASRVWRIYRAMLSPAAIRYISRVHKTSENWLDSSMSNDIFHSNTLEIIDRDIDDVFRKGNIILCSRTQSTITVVDPRTREMLWSWGPGVVELPHHPSLLDNGNLLIFDNGAFRHWSRVIELDPRTEEIVWEYRAENPRDFFSYSRGASERLPNGNTLITNSDSGIAFEVTAEGEIVWEFVNPATNVRGDRRAAIYRLMRFYDTDAYPCLDRLQSAP